MATITGFINSTQYDIFPSSNSTGTGKITSEKNVQTITAKLGIPSYKSSASDFELSYDGADLTITSGKANINGYWLELNSSVTASFVLASDGEYYVSFQLVYDNADLLTSDESGLCKCVSLVVDTLEPADTDLLLGTITKDGVTYDVVTDIKNIYALSLDAIPSPDGTDTLQNYLDTLPDTYVSKVADDTKEGKLEFVDSSDNVIVDIDPDTRKNIAIKSYGGQTKTTYVSGGEITLSAGSTPTPITSNALLLTNPDFSNRILIDNSKITVVSKNAMELPYVTTFGPVSPSVKNVTVTIDNNGGSPSISTTDSSLQIDVNSGAGTLNVSGNLTATGDIHANRVYNAVFNGFGEIFRKDKDEEIEYGDIVCVGPDGLVHKFDSLVYDIDSVVGVCSDTIGFMLGGENIPKEEQVEVELVGQIWVKTNMTYIKPGSMLAIASDGTVRVTTYRSERFGIALTNVIDGKVRVLYNGH